MWSRPAGIVCAVALSFALVAPAYSAEEHQYVGAKKCRSCHRKELMGDQYGAWEKGVHARAYETLRGEKAAELAAQKGVSGPPYEAEECLRCHVTAYGAPASAFDKRPLRARDGVQCESCHGPGSDYKSKKIMSDRERSLANGMWEPGKDEKICLACHNEESPTWDPAVGFDYEAAKEEIAHPIPEDVKGRYLELVEQRRSERGEDD